VCALEFVSPMTLPVPPETLYGEAYQGTRRESVMTEFHERVAIRKAIADEPELWFWTPAFQETLKWLDQDRREGAPVFEIGCGLGFFMHAARRRGIDIAGLDVAETCVELNRRDGFEVWHGNLWSLPEDWIEPQAVVCFFMLHHLEDPLGFLKEIRRRWPSARVSVSQYGPTNREPQRSSPPRTLTRWSSRSLEALFDAAGYHVRVVEHEEHGSQRGVMSPARQLLKKTIVFPPLYRLLRRMELRVVDPVLTPLTQSAYVVQAFGQPK
jgi:hypothetical protein